jgi:hypothetical protein
MEPKEIGQTRLMNQFIIDSTISDPAKLVSRMGALQAQDYNMSKWALGIRTKGSTNQIIEKAITEGSILRTHALRPTWHLVSSNDIHWILDLSAPQILPSLKSRHRELELDEKIFSKSFKIIEKILSNRIHFTRDEIMNELNRHKIVAEGQRAAHIMLMAELNKIVCSGSLKGKNQTYALLSEVVPKPIKLTREEAIDQLINIYFTTRGPASVSDFCWWSGLSITETKKALEQCKSKLFSFNQNSITYWTGKNFNSHQKIKDTILFLPAFDEFIICYKDRSAILPEDKVKHAISSNGLFRPVVVQEGQVIGIWKMLTSKNKNVIEIDLFNAKFKKAIKELDLKIDKFLNQKIEITFRK